MQKATETKRIRIRKNNSRKEADRGRNRETREKKEN